MKKSLIKALVLALTLGVFGTVSTVSAKSSSHSGPQSHAYKVNR